MSNFGIIIFAVVLLLSVAIATAAHEEQTSSSFVMDVTLRAIGHYPGYSGHDGSSSRAVHHFSSSKAKKEDENNQFLLAGVVYELDLPSATQSFFWAVRLTPAQENAELFEAQNPTSQKTENVCRKRTAASLPQATFVVSQETTVTFHSGGTYVLCMETKDEEDGHTSNSEQNKDKKKDEGSRHKIFRTTVLHVDGILPLSAVSTTTTTTTTPTSQAEEAMARREETLFNTSVKGLYATIGVGTRLEKVREKAPSSSSSSATANTEIKTRRRAGHLPPLVLPQFFAVSRHQSCEGVAEATGLLVAQTPDEQEEHQADDSNNDELTMVSHRLRSEQKFFLNRPGKFYLCMKYPQITHFVAVEEIVVCGVTRVQVQGASGAVVLPMVPLDVFVEGECLSQGQSSSSSSLVGRGTLELLAIEHDSGAIAVEADRSGSGDGGGGGEWPSCSADEHGLQLDVSQVRLGRSSPGPSSSFSDATADNSNATSSSCHGFPTVSSECFNAKVRTTTVSVGRYFFCYKTPTFAHVVRASFSLLSAVTPPSSSSSQKSTGHHHHHHHAHPHRHQRSIVKDSSTIQVRVPVSLRPSGARGTILDLSSLRVMGGDNDNQSADDEDIYSAIQLPPPQRFLSAGGRGGGGAVDEKEEQPPQTITIEMDPPPLPSSCPLAPPQKHGATTAASSRTNLQLILNSNTKRYPLPIYVSCVDDPHDDASSSSGSSDENSGKAGTSRKQVLVAFAKIRQILNVASPGVYTVYVSSKDAPQDAPPFSPGSQQIIVRGGAGGGPDPSSYLLKVLEGAMKVNDAPDVGSNPPPDGSSPPAKNPVVEIGSNFTLQFGGGSAASGSHQYHHRYHHGDFSSEYLRLLATSLRSGRDALQLVVADGGDDADVHAYTAVGHVGLLSTDKSKHPNQDGPSSSPLLFSAVVHSPALNTNTQHQKKKKFIISVAYIADAKNTSGFQQQFIMKGFNVEVRMPQVQLFHSPRRRGDEDQSTTTVKSKRKSVLLSKNLHSLHADGHAETLCVELTDPQVEQYATAASSSRVNMKQLASRMGDDDSDVLRVPLSLQSVLEPSITIESFLTKASNKKPTTNKKSQEKEGPKKKKERNVNGETSKKSLWCGHVAFGLGGSYSVSIGRGSSCGGAASGSGSALKVGTVHASGALPVTSASEATKTTHPRMTNQTLLGLHAEELKVPARRHRLSNIADDSSSSSSWMNTGRFFSLRAPPSLHDGDRMSLFACVDVALAATTHAKEMNVVRCDHHSGNTATTATTSSKKKIQCTPVPLAPTCSGSSSSEDIIEKNTAGISSAAGTVACFVKQGANNDKRGNTGDTPQHNHLKTKTICIANINTTKHDDDIAAQEFILSMMLQNHAAKTEDGTTTTSNKQELSLNYTLFRAVGTPLAVDVRPRVSLPSSSRRNRWLSGSKVHVGLLSTAEGDAEHPSPQLNPKRLVLFFAPSGTCTEPNATVLNGFFAVPHHANTPVEVIVPFMTYKPLTPADEVLHTSLLTGGIASFSSSSVSSFNPSQQVSLCFLDKHSEQRGTLVRHVELAGVLQPPTTTGTASSNTMKLQDHGTRTIFIVGFSVEEVRTQRLYLTPASHERSSGNDDVCKKAPKAGRKRLSSIFPLNGLSVVPTPNLPLGFAVSVPLPLDAIHQYWQSSGGAANNLAWQMCHDVESNDGQPNKYHTILLPTMYHSEAAVSAATGASGSIRSRRTLFAGTSDTIELAWSHTRVERLVGVLLPSANPTTVQRQRAPRTTTTEDEDDQQHQQQHPSVRANSDSGLHVLDISQFDCTPSSSSSSKSSSSPPGWYGGQEVFNVYQNKKDEDLKVRSIPLKTHKSGTLVVCIVHSIPAKHVSHLILRVQGPNRIEADHALGLISLHGLPSPSMVTGMFVKKIVKSPSSAAAGRRRDNDDDEKDSIAPCISEVGGVVLHQRRHMNTNHHEREESDPRRRGSSSRKHLSGTNLHTVTAPSFSSSYSVTYQADPSKLSPYARYAVCLHYNFSELFTGRNLNDAQKKHVGGGGGGSEDGAKNKAAGSGQGLVIAGRLKDVVFPPALVATASTIDDVGPDVLVWLNNAKAVAAAINHIAKKYNSTMSSAIAAAAQPHRTHGKNKKKKNSDGGGGGAAYSGEAAVASTSLQLHLIPVRAEKVKFQWYNARLQLLCSPGELARKGATARVRNVPSHVVGNIHQRLKSLGISAPFPAAAASTTTSTSSNDDRVGMPTWVAKPRVSGLHAICISRASSLPPSSSMPAAAAFTGFVQVEGPSYSFTDDPALTSFPSMMHAEMPLHAPPLSAPPPKIAKIDSPACTVVDVPFEIVPGSSAKMLLDGLFFAALPPTLQPSGTGSERGLHHESPPSILSTSESACLYPASGVSIEKVPLWEQKTESLAPLDSGDPTGAAAHHSRQYQLVTLRATFRNSGNYILCFRRQAKAYLHKDPKFSTTVNKMLKNAGIMTSSEERKMMKKDKKKTSPENGGGGGEDDPRPAIPVIGIATRGISLVHIPPPRFTLSERVVSLQRSLGLPPSSRKLEQAADASSVLDFHELTIASSQICGARRWALQSHDTGLEIRVASKLRVERGDQGRTFKVLVPAFKTLQQLMMISGSSIGGDDMSMEELLAEGGASLVVDVGDSGLPYTPPMVVWRLPISEAEKQEVLHAASTVSMKEESGRSLDESASKPQTQGADTTTTTEPTPTSDDSHQQYDDFYYNEEGDDDEAEESRTTADAPASTSLSSSSTSNGATGDSSVETKQTATIFPTEFGLELFEKENLTAPLLLGLTLLILLLFILLSFVAPEKAVMLYELITQHDVLLYCTVVAARIPVVKTVLAKWQKKNPQLEQANAAKENEEEECSGTTGGKKRRSLNQSANSIETTKAEDDDDIEANLLLPTVPAGAMQWKSPSSSAAANLSTFKAMPMEGKAKFNVADLTMQMSVSYGGQTIPTGTAQRTVLVLQFSSSSPQLSAFTPDEQYWRQTLRCCKLLQDTVAYRRANVSHSSTTFVSPIARTTVAISSSGSDRRLSSSMPLPSSTDGTTTTTTAQATSPCLLFPDTCDKTLGIWFAQQLGQPRTNRHGHSPSASFTPEDICQAVKAICSVQVAYEKQQRHLRKKQKKKCPPATANKSGDECPFIVSLDNVWMNEKKDAHPPATSRTRRSGDDSLSTSQVMMSGRSEQGSFSARSTGRRGPSSARGGSSSFSLSGCKLCIAPIVSPKASGSPTRTMFLARLGVLLSWFLRPWQYHEACIQDYEMMRAKKRAESVVAAAAAEVNDQVSGAAGKGRRRQSVNPPTPPGSSRSTPQRPETSQQKTSPAPTPPAGGGGVTPREPMCVNDLFEFSVENRDKYRTAAYAMPSSSSHHLGRRGSSAASPQQSLESSLLNSYYDTLLLGSGGDGDADDGDALLLEASGRLMGSTSDHYGMDDGGAFRDLLELCQECLTASLLPGRRGNKEQEEEPKKMKKKASTPSPQTTTNEEANNHSLQIRGLVSSPRDILRFLEERQLLSVSATPVTSSRKNNKQQGDAIMDSSGSSGADESDDSSVTSGTSRNMKKRTGQHHSRSASDYTPEEVDSAFQRRFGKN